ENYPSLGTQQSIRADLVVAEFEARRSEDLQLEFSRYQSRFPQQFSVAKQILAERSQMDAQGHRGGSGEPVQVSQATVDTSRIMDGRGGASDRPIEFGPELPVEFGRYRILKEVGAGAMGRVYLAHDTQLDRKVAIKTPSFSEGENGDLVARFYREARSAAKLQHRNICPVYDVGEIGARHFISMGFIQGRPLSDYVRPGKLPTQRSAAMLVQRIAVAMAEAHQHNVIHRDLKPANIMIDRKKEPVVMDFGLARELDSTSRFTQQGVAVGTPAYMAPEQIQGEPDEIGTAADIYALGVILYELLTGKLPFRGPMAKVVYSIVHEPPKLPSEMRTGIDSRLEAICLQMMAKDRSERYSSMNDVATALRDYLKNRKTISETNDSSKVSATNDASKSKAASASIETKSQSKESDAAALKAFLASQTELRRSASISVATEGTNWKAAAEVPSVGDGATTRAERDNSIDSISDSYEPYRTDKQDGAHGRKRRPWPWVATGVAFIGLVIAGVTFLMRSGDAVLRVVINDPSIGFKVQDQTLTIDDNGREIKLKPSDDNRLTISIGETT
ncbi:MAG: serine/threonine-protein kinase, partial [Planctomycetota bacterium]